MKPLRTVQCLLALLLFSLGCKTAKVTSEQGFGTTSYPRPTAVYVVDFELGAQGVQHEPGVLSGRVGPLGRVGDRLSGGSTDPATRAQQLIDLMAESLVKELSKSGFNAIRLHSGFDIRGDGWLLQGLFTEVQEGNRVRRALIGFGQGQTDLQVIANVQDLSKGPPKPLYQLSTESTSGGTPGAGPTLVLGPYGAAARFVLAGKDLDKDVKRTAAQIAERMAKRVQQPN